MRGVTRVEPQEPGRPRVIGVYGPEEHFSRRVSDFLKREAKKDIEPTVQRHARKLRVDIGRISVKDTISRWGSCSAKGDLAFSWRLILAPPFVLDYLCAHEVGHRREMNHGDRFWKIVYRLFPETEEAEAWLKAHGSDLHRYGMIPPEKRTRRSAQGNLPLRSRGSPTSRLQPPNSRFRKSIGVRNGAGSSPGGRAPAHISLRPGASCGPNRPGRPATGMPRWAAVM